MKVLSALHVGILIASAAVCLARPVLVKDTSHRANPLGRTGRRPGRGAEQPTPATPAGAQSGPVKGGTPPKADIYYCFESKKVKVGNGDVGRECISLEMWQRLKDNGNPDTFRKIKFTCENMASDAWCSDKGVHQLRAPDHCDKLKGCQFLPEGGVGSGSQVPAVPAVQPPAPAPGSLFNKGSFAAAKQRGDFNFQQKPPNAPPLANAPPPSQAPPLANAPPPSQVPPPNQAPPSVNALAPIQGPVRANAHDLDTEMEDAPPKGDSDTEMPDAV